jgi:prepilin-type N-terminal cleavage/methylation domain-containing protein
MNILKETNRNSGFSLIELLIAITISAFVILGIYSMFSGVLITKDGIDRVNNDMHVMQSFQRLMARDIRMMHSKAVTNLPLETRDWQIVFSMHTQNSLRFNKSIPVEVIYTLEDGTLYRTERHPDMNYIMKLLIMKDISDIRVESYNGREYTANVQNNHNIFRFTFYYRDRLMSFTTGRLVESTGE